ncbi:MAG: exodeoxyribonuclease III [Gammaproteobacteria bacterium]|nr:MAG: exodeoxyribonuclease III [Gammaproteobacteria bacterium]
MRIVTFNVNGIRARLHQLKALVETLSPDIIGLQEVKADDESFPYDDVRALGLHVETFGQKGHYGVALLSQQAPISVIRGLPNDPEDTQKRLITATYEMPDGSPLTVINGYFPQGESRAHPVKFPHKERFYRALTEWLHDAHDSRHPLVVLGDFNIAPQDIDIGIGEENAKRWLRTGKCSFLPEEREWFERLLDWGLVDLYRHIHPTKNDKFSWFDYRSRGFEREPKRGLRIDGILGTKVLADVAQQADIDYDIRAMAKPSDHAPVWVDLAL